LKISKRAGVPLADFLVRIIFFKFYGVYNMSKYQEKVWTKADSDAFNKKRAKQLASIDIESMSVVSILGLCNSELDVAITKCEQFNNVADKEKLLMIKSTIYEVKKAISDKIQERMAKKNSVDQAPEVSRMETASA
tara:strand:- start:109 stop:516 length:408 start_codon:yes stop_codon:yes gene_type:complete